MEGWLAEQAESLKSLTEAGKGDRMRGGNLSVQSRRKKDVQSCLTLCDPMDVARWATLSMGFSRQEYRSGLSFPIPRDLSNPESKATVTSPALAGGFFTTSTTRGAQKEGGSVQFRGRRPSLKPSPRAGDGSCLYSEPSPRSRGVVGMGLL